MWAERSQDSPPQNKRAACIGLRRVTRRARTVCTPCTRCPLPLLLPVLLPLRSPRPLPMSLTSVFAVNRPAVSGHLAVCKRTRATHPAHAARPLPVPCPALRIGDNLEIASFAFLMTGFKRYALRFDGLRRGVGALVCRSAVHS